MANIGNYSGVLHGEDHFDEIDVPERTQEGDAVQGEEGFDDHVKLVLKSSVAETEADVGNRLKPKSRRLYR